MPVRTTPRAGAASTATTTPRTARKPAATPTTPAGRTAGGALTSRGTPQRAGAAASAAGTPRSPATSRRKATGASSQAGADALAEAHAAARFWREHANPALTSPDDSRRPAVGNARPLLEEPTPRTPLREPFRALSGNHAAPSSPKLQPDTPSPMPRDRSDNWEAQLAAELELLRAVPARSGSGGRRDRSSRSPPLASDKDDGDDSCGGVVNTESTVVVADDDDDADRAARDQEELLLFAAANHSGGGRATQGQVVENSSFRLEATRSSSAAFMTATPSMPASPVDVAASIQPNNAADKPSEDEAAAGVNQTHITVDMSVAADADDTAANETTCSDGGASEADTNDVGLSAPYGFTPWTGPAATAPDAQSVLSPLALRLREQQRPVSESPTVRDLSSEPISPGPALRPAPPTMNVESAGADQPAASAAEELSGDEQPDAETPSRVGHQTPDVSPVFVFEGNVTPATMRETKNKGAEVATTTPTPVSAVEASPVFALELTPTPEPVTRERCTPDLTPTRSTTASVGTETAVPRLSWGSAASPAVRGSKSTVLATQSDADVTPPADSRTAGAESPAGSDEGAAGCCDFSAVEPPTAAPEACCDGGVVAATEPASAHDTCPKSEHDGNRGRGDGAKERGGGCCIVA